MWERSVGRGKENMVPAHLQKTEKLVDWRHYKKWLFGKIMFLPLLAYPTKTNQ